MHYKRFLTQNSLLPTWCIQVEVIFSEISDDSADTTYYSSNAEYLGEQLYAKLATVPQRALEYPSAAYAIGRFGQQVGIRRQRCACTFARTPPVG
jgi:hypothetical protein